MTLNKDQELVCGINATNEIISIRSDLLSIMDPMMLASVYNDSTYVLASFGFNAISKPPDV